MASANRLSQVPGRKKARSPKSARDVPGDVAIMPQRSGEGQLVAEISASAVRENLRLLRQRLAPRTALCAVVKADFYGHGCASLLDVIGPLADWLAVATPAEALELRRLGWGGPVLMFFSPGAYAIGHTDRVLADLIAADVTLTVVAADELRAVAAVARRLNRRGCVHVKIDTGMARSGVNCQRAASLIERARSTDDVELAGLCTHFASADEADKTFTRQQLGRFLAAVEASGGGEGLMLHAANSAAAIDLPETHLDMVRAGIAVYGLQPSHAMHTRLPLRPAMRVCGRLMQVKDVPRGGRCGYGLAHAFDRDSRVGLVPIGYADGYLRCLSGKAVMRVAGCDAPICGRVSMDQVIIDLTDARQARVGDEVEIFSRNPADPHSVENLARLAGTIPYEIVCRLGSRASRVAVD